MRQYLHKIFIKFLTDHPQIIYKVLTNKLVCKNLIGLRTVNLGGKLYLDPSDQVTIRKIMDKINNYREKLSKIIHDEPEKCCIIDIGANDGVLSSNSFSFVLHGMNAVLVEPHPKVFNYLKNNVFKIKNNNQKIYLINKAINLYKSNEIYLETNIEGDLVNMEGYITNKKSKNNFKVKSIEIDEFLKKFNFFKNYKAAILSIDVEGIDLEMLTCFLEYPDFKPDVICVESFRYDRTQFHKTVEKYGYSFVDIIHWNSIFFKNN